MLISPLNIETNKLVKKRRFNFDTANRNYGNLVIIATNTYDDYTNVITSKLFKPQQLFSAYSPRRIKPMNRMYISYFQKETYDMIREKTNNFIKIGKALPSAYVGRNLLYDIVPEYSETAKLLGSIKHGDPAQHIYLQQFIQTLISDKVEEMNYEQTYVIFPMCNYIKDFKAQVQLPTSVNHDPIIEFLKALRHGTFNKEKFARVSRIFFYNPNADAMVVMDPQNPEIVDNYLDYFQKINRLNNFNNKTDSLDDVVEDDINVTDDDLIENTKEKIKDIVLTDVSKKLKAKLDDYDDATTEEKSIITSIDRKIDKYLSKPENTEKSFDELVKEVEEDKEVTAKAVNYIETKKLAQKQLVQLSKNIDKETEIIDSLDAVIDEADKFVEPEKIKANIPMINKTVQMSSLPALDRAYNEKQAKIDLASCIASFSDQDYLPITIVGWNMVDTSDDFTLKNTLTVKYKTVENRTLSFKIDIPIVFDGCYIKIKGNTYIIQKQICRLPIVKTKENRVEIATNFNKITCERTNGNISRRNAYLKKILQRHKMNPAFGIEYGYNIEINSAFKNDFEFEELSSFLNKITTMKYEINTNRSLVEREFGLLSYPESFTITDKMTPFGFELGEGNTKNLLYIENTEIFVARPNGTNAVEIDKLADNLYTFIVRDILKDDPNVKENIGNSYIYSNCKFISVTYPIFVFCGLNIGITATLKKAKIKYKVSETRLDHNIEMVEVPFRNKFLYYEDTIENTLLLNALQKMNTLNWDYEDFDTDEPYVDYCVNVLGQPIYVKQTVRININKLIDPITRDVLNYLHLPTDPFDLLIMANNMLTNNTYIPKNDLCNFRIRGNETIYAILYEIIARAYYKYQNAKLNGSNKETIKVNQNELISTLIGLQNVNIASTLNPILEVEAMSSCSMKGHRGINLKDAYTLELRSFDKSMVGILSANSTPYSGAVGIQRSLTVNPKLNHVRGYIPQIDPKELDAANRLSASELISYATAPKSDAPRIAMQVSQSKHGIPVAVANRQLVGSGYDRTLPFMISDGFCFKAKKDGLVESIDLDNKLAILAYNDGTYDAIDLKDSLAKNSNSGFYINQTFLMKYDVNESFKAGDVIAYNPSFFTGKGTDCAFTQGTLAKVAITSGDFVFEDSTYVSERLSNKCASDITMEKAVALGPNTIIHNIVNVGDHVEINDDLLNFTTSFDDATTTEFLQDLMNTLGDDKVEDIGNEVIKSKYPGKVVDIDIYYNVPFETLSPSLQDLITNYNKNIERRKKVLISKGIKPATIKLKTVGQITEDKVNGTEFNGVLIVFYVSHLDKLAVGDKLTYSVALKGVVTRVCANDEAPHSDFRKDEIIDGCCASFGIPKRMTMDVWQQMATNKALVELGRWIHSEWKK